jgi:cellulose biosynthesis protein BcsQ
MNIITLASRKVGSGKTTLTACLAACAQAWSRCLVIDADPRARSCTAVGCARRVRRRS